MSEKTISIKTYNLLENPLRFDAKVHLPESNLEAAVPSNLVLNLTNLYNEEGSKLSIREENSHIVFKFRVLFNEGFTENDLRFLVHEDELPYKTLGIRIQATCKKTKWCSAQRILSVTELSRKDHLEIQIPLSEVKEIVSVTYFITRETETKKLNDFKANSAYSILGSGEEIKVLVDETKEIGGNYFPISPKEGLGEQLFKIEGLNQSITLPEIFFNKEFEEWFNRNDLLVVNSSFLMLSFYILDEYLKWLVFTSSYEDNDKEYRSLLELYSKYCQLPKHKISEVVNLEKFSPQQTNEYLQLSRLLFQGVQQQGGINFKKELKNLVKQELKIKSYEGV